MIRFLTLLFLISLTVLPLFCAAQPSRLPKRSGQVIINAKGVQVVDITPPGHTTRWHLVYNFEKETVALVRIAPVPGGLQVVSIQSLTKTAKPTAHARPHAAH